MVKRSPTLGALVNTKTKCTKLIFIGKITLVPVAFLMALSVYSSKTRIVRESGYSPLQLCNKLDFVNMNAYSKFDEILSICSQDIERKFFLA